MINTRTKEEVGYIYQACQIVKDTLNYLENEIADGVMTCDLDKLAEEFILSKNAIPAFKGLYGFPGTICISINDEVVHGIPKKRIIKNGDIVGVDVGSIVNGYYGDHARTFMVGEVDKKVQKLIKVTHDSLIKGIEAVKPGNSIGDIGYAIQKNAESQGFSVVRTLVGHGIGTKLHEEPQIPNFGVCGTGPLIKEGMCFAIEPMINLGNHEVYTADDNWTICTSDGKVSAHFEHTVTVTKDGSKILTI